jgi:hypothetical protein
VANPIAQLVDPFHATTQNTALWDQSRNLGTLLFGSAGAIFSIPPAGGGGNEAEMWSLNTYDLTGSQTSVRVVDAGTPNNGSAQLYFGLNSPTVGGTLGWMVAGSGYIYVFTGTYNSKSFGANTPYDPAVHKYFRLRESGGTTYWDWSTDGTTWTTFYSQSTPAFVTGVQVYLDFRCPAISGQDQRATLDNYGGVPPPPPTSIDVTAAAGTGSTTAPATSASTSAPAAQATGSATAPTSSTGASAPQASASATAAATVSGAKAIDVTAAPASASALAPSTRVAASAPQANATSAAPPPVIGLVGPPVNLDVGPAQGSATSAPAAISASASPGSAAGSCVTRTWSQALSSSLTAALITGRAPAPTVTLAYSLRAPAAVALAQAWPMDITGGRVNVAGPPIPAGGIVSARSGAVVSATAGRVATGGGA